ncbi:ubiquinol-cytochrome c reductase iron-sulfur subunit [Bacteroidota bacterium]
MKRRDFLRRLALTLASIGGAIAGISYLRQLSPKVIGKVRRVKVGRVSDFPVDTYTFLEEHKIFVYRDHESMKAVSAVCTHLGCAIQRTTEGFECPCHGSCYNDEGRVLSGPAPRALAWYSMEKMPDGTIIVDMDEQTTNDTKFSIS